MTSYSLDKLLDMYVDPSSSSKTSAKASYMDWVNRYVEIAHPDFLTVVDVQATHPVVFQKNYNLKFPEGSKETVQEIIDATDEIQRNKIFVADTKVAQFVYENEVEPKKCIFHLRYNVTLIPGDTRSFMRSVTLLERDGNGKPKYLLSSLFDITEMQGVETATRVDIKNFGDNGNALCSKLQALKDHLVKIFLPVIKLTKREKVVLDLISQGKTSKQIAEELYISITTVNTHRQNLIRKNNVNNTSALLKTV